MAPHPAPTPSTTQRKAQTKPTLDADTQEIIRACAVLCPHGYTELRALHCSGNVPDLGFCKGIAVSGYFDDWRKLAAWAAKLSAFSRGVYIVLNPFTPALLARCYNRVALGCDATKDDDIVSRIWLPLDFDPTRPAGVSSSDEEKALAHAAMLFTRGWLADNLPQAGTPAFVADSGNGYHMGYRVDLPRDDNGIVQNVLLSAANACKEWQGGQVRVTLDAGNFNPARIWKLYGTAARKGDDFRGNKLGHAPRPWRASRILELNGEVL